MINSCNGGNSNLELIKAKHLSNFPSASTIEYNDGKIYLLGDDASYLLILDTAYNLLDTVQYMPDTSQRISKHVKQDIESSTIVSINHETYLYAMGSCSAENRKRSFYFPLSHIHDYKSDDLSFLLWRLNSLPEINIEGLTTVNSKLVLANRANKTNKINKLIVASDSLLKYETTPLLLIDLLFGSSNAAGVSGLYYLKEKDMLFFTASEEDTPSATQDGVINDSYLGWINKFSGKMNKQSVEPDQMINLSSVGKDLKKQKIESVCVENISGNKVILHLAADNDNGESTLFKNETEIMIPLEP